MKQMLKYKIITLLLVIASVFLLAAGCSFKISLDEFMEDNHLVAQVTYYANGGLLENKNEPRTLYYKEGQKALDIGNVKPSKGEISLAYSDHEFLGWYYVQLDDNGELVKDENGDVILGEKVDFSITLKEGDVWTVAAKWRVLPKVRVKLVGQEGMKIVDATKDVTYEIGSEIYAYSFTNGEVQSTANAPMTAKDNSHTFLAFYADEARTTAVQWPLKDEGKDIIIYAEYIEGNWTVLRTSDDVKQLWNRANAADAEKRFYLLNDIDCSDLSAREPLSMFNAELQGNGYTISNLKISQTGLTTGASASMFGNIGETAVIENVSFKNITMTLSARSGALIYVYAAFTSIADSATLQEVSLDIQISVDLPSSATIANAPRAEEGDGLVKINWKFGGFENDEAYDGEGKVVFSAESDIKLEKI